LKRRYLANNRRRSLADNLVKPRLRRSAKAALIVSHYSLGRELNWGERVFDLVGHSASDFAPGSRALSLNQVRQVLDHNHQSFDRAFGSSKGNRGRGGRKLGAIRALKFYFSVSDLASTSATTERGELVGRRAFDHSLNRLSDFGFVFQPEHPQRRAIDGRDASVLVG